MPVVDSFLIDHKKLPFPSLRIAKELFTSSGDVITVYDLRFCEPNKVFMPTKGIHTVEHLLAGYIRDYLADNKDCKIIDVSPMGCHTGFYMSIIGQPNIDDIIVAWKKSMEKILLADVVPAANEYQCGAYKMHSLEEAKEIAKMVLSKEIVAVNSKDIMLDISTIDPSIKLDL